MGNSLIRRLAHAFRSPPIARHALPSWIASADDDPGPPDMGLVETSLDAVREALTADLADIVQRDEAIGRFVRVWPGEHYKLLAGFVRSTSPRSVVEIGTATGASALALLRYLPPGARLTTFDILPWNSYPASILTEDDFKSGQLAQEVADVSTSPDFERYRPVLEEAELLFIDAAKDGIMEQRLLSLLSSLGARQSRLVIFDDIRVPNMVDIWRGIDRPKLDLTSFGHWSGTGVVRFS